MGNLPEVRLQILRLAHATVVTESVAFMTAWIPQAPPALPGQRDREKMGQRRP